MAELLTRAFLEQINGFGNFLGPVFLQLSEKISPKNALKLFRYLQTLPSAPQFFLEVRQPEWFENISIRKDLFDTLRGLKIGAVINDSLAHPEGRHMELTIPKTFIRFSCIGDHYTDNKRIDDWAQRVKSWQDAGLQETYFFVHAIKDGFSPEITRYVSRRFNAVCNANLPEVKLLTMF